MGTLLVALIVAVVVAVAVAQNAVQAAPNSTLKPLGAGEFKLPTSDSSRAIPYIAGTVLHESPNIILGGGFKSAAFHVDGQHAGYHYAYGIIVSLCYGPDVVLHSMISGDFVLFKDAHYDGTETSTSYNGVYNGEFYTEGHVFKVQSTNLYGWRQGGPALNFSFFSGQGDQKRYHASPKVGGANMSPTSNTSNGMSVTLPARSWGNMKFISYLAMWGIWGTNGSIRNMKFEVSRFPRPAALKTVSTDGNDTPYYQINDGAYEDGDSRVRYDANPAFVLFELLTNSLYGAGIPISSMDTASFSNVGIVLHAANFGISLQLDEKATMNNIKQEIEKHINGIIETDKTTGKLSLRLLRKDWDLETLPRFGDNDIENVTELAQTSIDTINTEFKAKYIDRRRQYTTQIAPAYNNAALMALGNVNSLEMPYLMCYVEKLAQKIAWREMRMLAAAPKPMELIVSRAAYDVKKGDNIVIDWTPLGLVDFVVRVKTVALGDALSPTITLNVVEDVFREDNAIFDLDLIGDIAPPDLEPPSGDLSEFTEVITLTSIGGTTGKYLGFSNWGGGGVKQSPNYGSIASPGINGSIVRQIRRDFLVGNTLKIILNLINLGTVDEPVYYAKNYIRKVTLEGIGIFPVTSSTGFVIDTINMLITWTIDAPEGVTDEGDWATGQSRDVTFLLDPAFRVGGAVDTGFLFIEAPMFFNGFKDSVHVFPLFESPDPSTPQYVHANSVAGIESVKHYFPVKYVTQNVIGLDEQFHPHVGTFATFAYDEVIAAKITPYLNEVGDPVADAYFDPDPNERAGFPQLTLDTHAGFSPTYYGHKETFNIFLLCNSDGTQQEFVCVSGTTDRAVPEDNAVSVSLRLLLRGLFGTDIYEWPIGTNMWAVDTNFMTSQGLVYGSTYIDSIDNVEKMSPVNRIGLLGASDLGGVSGSDPTYQDFIATDRAKKPFCPKIILAGVHGKTEAQRKVPGTQRYRKLAMTVAQANSAPASLLPAQYDDSEPKNFDYFKHDSVSAVMPIYIAHDMTTTESGADIGLGGPGFGGFGDAKQDEYTEVKYFNHDTSTQIGLTRYHWTSSPAGYDDGRHIRNGITWRAANPDVVIGDYEEGEVHLPDDAYPPGENIDIRPYYTGGGGTITPGSNRDYDNVKTADLFNPGENYMLRVEFRGLNVVTGRYSEVTRTRYIKVERPV